MEIIKITDIPGIKIGHDQNLEACTGCTVIICEKGAVAGVDVRGGAPGTRETDLLDPINLVDRVHAVLLAGGSAFGLDASAGVMEYLERVGIGFDVGVTKVPIVTGAVIFDLTAGKHDVRPNKLMGYRACVNANNITCPEGNIGAGTGATVGKALGMDYCMKSGLGTFALKIGGLMVGAVVAVNCFGDVFDSETGKIIAGTLDESKTNFVNTEKIMIENYNNSDTHSFSSNTTIAAVITNADLTKAQANKVASMAHDGYARAINPIHTMNDGDTIFAMSTGDVKADVNVVGILAAKVIEKAIVSAVKNTDSILGFKCAKDLEV